MLQIAQGDVVELELNLIESHQKNGQEKRREQQYL